MLADLPPAEYALTHIVVGEIVVRESASPVVELGLEITGADVHDQRATRGSEILPRQ
jgi:hypothetical protein